MSSLEGRPLAAINGLWTRTRHKLFAGLIILASAWLFPAPAAAYINLEFRTANPWHAGDTVRVGLYAVSDTPDTQPFDAVQALCFWDPAFLTLLGTDQTGAVSWELAGFTPNDPFGFNESNPPQDGDGLWYASNPPSVPILATAQGVLLTTFEFQALTNTGSTSVNLVLTATKPGHSAAYTRAISAGADVLGTLAGASVMLVSRPPGDTCATALVITSLPFRAEGSTCNADDDYDETCDKLRPSTPRPTTQPAGGSPDIVYQYTPTSGSLAVDISLCRSSAYDTKLYVYEDACGAYQSGSAIACSDDACTTPLSPSGVVSELVAVNLIAGHTYYFVVDGNGGDCGNYTIDVYASMPGPNCPEDTVFGLPAHRPDWAWNAGYSEADVGGDNYRRLQLFSRYGYGPICALEWWGLMQRPNGEGTTDCVDGNPTFEVTFYEDLGGTPGAPWLTYQVVPTIEATGLSYDYHILQHFTVDILSPCCLLEQGWVSIQGQGDADCWFNWMGAGEDVGYGYSLLSVNNGPLASVPFDLSMCLRYGDGPPTGACCYHQQGYCEWDVPAEFCAGPDEEFILGGTCDDFNPPCNTVDCNHNGIPDDVDIAGGNSLDCQPDGVPDECQIGTGTYKVDNGLADDMFPCFGSVSVYLNQFRVETGAETINAIAVASAPMPWGRPAWVYLWSDPNGDGDPTDALVLREAQTILGEYDWFTRVDIPDTFVGPAGTSFFVGFILHAYQPEPAVFVSQMALPAGRSWVAGSSTLTLDPNDLGSAELPPLNLFALGYPGNFMIRAMSPGATAGNDCNGNGVPDDCDIASGFSPDVNMNNIPDECEGVPGACCDPDGRCQLLPLFPCHVLGGTWFGEGVPCYPDPCSMAQEWACCHADGTCQMLTLYACDAAGGTWLGPPVTCDPNPCAPPDCNGNGEPDADDIANGTSRDCNSNGIPDECDIAAGTSRDCNSNGTPDECDVVHGSPVVVHHSFRAWIDGRDDLIIQGATVQWLHFEYSAPGQEQANEPTYVDGVPWYPAWPNGTGFGAHSSVYASLAPPLPGQDMTVQMNVVEARGTASIVQLPNTQNGYTLIVEFDDNTPGGAAWYEVAIDASYIGPASTDCNGNGIPDECEPDCNSNGVADSCDIAGGTSKDCNTNGIPDECDIASGRSHDVNLNSVPDECETDSDGDGIVDALDGCPNDRLKIAPGACGCGHLETDSDADGTPDCIDGCPNDPNKTAAGACGCGKPETDTDHDGTPDCSDGCPNDPRKITPGACGCGKADTDTDGDGVPDCLDNCPTVSNANQSDSDGDGIGDACQDMQSEHEQPTSDSGPAFMRGIIEAIARGDTAGAPADFANALNHLATVIDGTPGNDLPPTGESGHADPNADENALSADELEQRAIEMGLCPTTSALMLSLTLLGLHASRRHRTR